MKTTLQIKSIVRSLLFEYDSKDNTVKKTLEEAVKSGANLSRADLSGADLSGADLFGANLFGADLSRAKNIPQSYINICSRDMLFIFEHLKAELPFLREKLIKGEVDGTQYEGECACLIGTLANADGGVDKVCKMIPYYEKGLHNMGEQWFYNIKKGDTPETNEFAKHALFLIDRVLGSKVAESKKKSK